MHELPTTASKDIIPYAKLNRITWYFSGMIVFVNSATLSVPLIIVVVVVVEVLVGFVIDVVRVEIEVKNLMVASGLTVFFNDENVIASIYIYTLHSAQVN